MASQDAGPSQVLLERVLKQLDDIQSVAQRTQQRLDLLEQTGTSREVQRDGQHATEQGS